MPSGDLQVGRRFSPYHFTVRLTGPKRQCAQPPPVVPAAVTVQYDVLATWPRVRIAPDLGQVPSAVEWTTDRPGLTLK